MRRLPLAVRWGSGIVMVPGPRFFVAAAGRRQPEPGTCPAPSARLGVLLYVVACKVAPTAASLTLPAVPLEKA
jgi:hypothetical protein